MISFFFPRTTNVLSNVLLNLLYLHDKTLRFLQTFRYNANPLNDQKPQFISTYFHTGAGPERGKDCSNMHNARHCVVRNMQQESTYERAQTSSIGTWKRRLSKFYDIALRITEYIGLYLTSHTLSPQSFINWA